MFHIDENPFALKTGVRQWHQREVVVPKPEEYLIAEIIPANSLVCLETNGVYGKTTLAMQIAMSVAFDLPFLGRFPCFHQGKVLFVSARDTEDDNHRRYKRLVREWSKGKPDVLGRIEGNLDNLTCVSMYDDCYSLSPHLVDGSGNNTKTYTYLHQFIEYYKTKLVILDPLEEFFPESLKQVFELYRKLRHLNTTVLLIVENNHRYDAFHGVEVGLFLNETGLTIKNFHTGHREIHLEIGAGIWAEP